MTNFDIDLYYHHSTINMVSDVLSRKLVAMLLIQQKKLIE